MNRKHFLSLDGLRGVAAISVVMFHRRWYGPGGHAFDHGFMAVSFFFMLSGFVIDHAYATRLRSTLSLSQFAKVRAIRLYPVIVAGAVLGSSLHIADSAAHHNLSGVLVYVAAMLFSMVCVPAPAGFVDQPYIVNRPTWSLFNELIANAAYAVFLVRLKNLHLIILTIIAVLFSVWMALRFNTLNRGFYYGQLKWGLVAVFAPFMIGVLLNRFRMDRHFWPSPFWLSALLLVATFQLPPVRAPFDGIYQVVMMLTLYPLLILSAQEYNPTGFWLNAAKYSAYISYPLYAIHYPILIMGDRFVSSIGVERWIFLIMITVVCIAIATVAAYFYETPVRGWLGRRFGARSAAAGSGITVGPMPLRTEE